MRRNIRRQVSHCVGQTGAELSTWIFSAIQPYLQFEPWFQSVSTLLKKILPRPTKHHITTGITPMLVQLCTQLLRIQHSVFCTAMGSTEHGSRLENWGQNRARQAFQAALEDFEKARERMREESEKTWRRWEEESKHFFGDSKIFPPDMKWWSDEWWLSGSDFMFGNSFDEMKKSIKSRRNMFDAEDNGKAKVVEDNSKMEVFLSTDGFKPSELSVNVCEGMICVQGKHEEKSEEGNVMVLREFTRKYGLPQNAKAEDVESTLLKDGTLKVSVWKVGLLKN